jgi:hypothetical protein
MKGNNQQQQEEAWIDLGNTFVIRWPAGLGHIALAAAEVFDSVCDTLSIRSHRPDPLEGELSDAPVEQLVRPRGELLAARPCTSFSRRPGSSTGKVRGGKPCSVSRGQVVDGELW